MRIGSMANEIFKPVDKQSRIPLYVQVLDQFILAIDKKLLKEGGKISNEYELCEQFQVSRFTLRQALKELEIDGPVGRLDAWTEHYPFVSVSHFIKKLNFYTDLEAKVLLEKEGIIDKKDVIYNLRKRPLKLFRKYYFKKRGYKDGFPGLIYASLMAIRHIMLYAKYWELVKDKYN